MASDGKPADERVKLAVVIGVALAIVLTGCATAAQRQAQQTGAVLTAAKAEVRACAAAVWGKPEYAPLVPHRPDLETGQATMAQLTNETLPSVIEARLLATVYDDLAPCRSHVLVSFSAVRPDVVPILSEAFTKSAAITVLLVQRKMTWGEGTRREQDRLNDFRQKSAAADRQWRADLNTSHQAEMANRQAAAAAMMQWSAQQQMINAVNRPRQTNCTGFGNSVNCTSY